MVMTDEATKAAQAMREMAAWVAANAADNPLFDLDNGSVHRTGSWIAEAIRALPLPASSLTTPPEAITGEGPIDSDLSLTVGEKTTEAKLEILRHSLSVGPVVSDAADKRDEALKIAREALKPFAEYAETQFYPADRTSAVGTGPGAFGAGQLFDAVDALSAIEAALGRL